MSLGELVYYTSGIKRTSLRFRFSIPNIPAWVYLLPKSVGHQSPAELSGKKIGFPRWVQTAAIWIRGTLVDEFGLSAKDTQWYVISMHHWDDADPESRVQPRDGSAIQWLQSNGKDTSDRVCRALFDGEVDAIGVTEAQLALLSNKP